MRCYGVISSLIRYHEPISSLNREIGKTSWTELGHFLIMYFDKRVERLILVAYYTVRNESLSLTKQSMDSVAGKFTYLVPTNFIIVSKSITDHPADWKRSPCLISINSFAMMILHLHLHKLVFLVSLNAFYNTGCQDINLAKQRDVHII